LKGLTLPMNAFKGSNNVDQKVVSGFGDEWVRFDQTKLGDDEIREAFDGYFKIFPWEKLTSEAEGFDMGCGSGRWAKLVAPRVGKLNCLDPSEQALSVAKKTLKNFKNCFFFCSAVDGLDLLRSSQDFGYCLGVLHHVPDTFGGLKSCVEALKPEAPFLLYLYYAFDNRPRWFRSIWMVSDLIRRAVSRLPYEFRYAFSQLIAAFVYWPLARTSKMMESMGINVSSFPLSYYKRRSFYTMRTDALDRFGTRLEKRFSKEQIFKMMSEAGLENISFSDTAPFWCAIGYRRAS
jgi:SAM-dependent methyltransferase